MNLKLLKLKAIVVKMFNLQLNFLLILCSRWEKNTYNFTHYLHYAKSALLYLFFYKKKNFTQNFANLKYLTCILTFFWILLNLENLPVLTILLYLFRLSENVAFLHVLTLNLELSQKGVLLLRVQSITYLQLWVKQVLGTCVNFKSYEFQKFQSQKLTFPGFSL